MHFVSLCATLSTAPPLLPLQPLRLSSRRRATVKRQTQARMVTAGGNGNGNGNGDGDGDGDDAFDSSMPSKRRHVRSPEDDDGSKEVGSGSDGALALAGRRVKDLERRLRAAQSLSRAAGNAEETAAKRERDAALHHRRLAAEADRAKAQAVREAHRRAEAAADAKTKILERRLAQAETAAHAAAAASAAAERERSRAAKIKQDLARKAAEKRQAKAGSDEGTHSSDDVF